MASQKAVTVTDFVKSRGGPGATDWLADISVRGGPSGATTAPLGASRFLAVMSRDQREGIERKSGRR